MNDKANQKMYMVIVLGIVISMAGNTKADFTFSTPINLGPTVNSSDTDGTPSISADGLLLFFMSDRPGGYGVRDIWVTTRETIEDEWGVPMNLGPIVNSSFRNDHPKISTDGCTLYFCSDRPGGYGNRDIWMVTRETIEDEWSTPVNLGLTVNSGDEDILPSISADGLSLFFDSLRPGGYGHYDLWVTTRLTISDPWSMPINLGPTINLSSLDGNPSISADDLSLFFMSVRSGGYGGQDMWLTRRATTDDPWLEPENLGSTVNSSHRDLMPFITVDGSTLYFCSNRPGGSGGLDLWQASINPVVDLNADRIVDSADMCIIVDHWGTNEPLCDIGPMPWGDGIVDVEDLIVLAEHLFEEVQPNE